MKRTRRRVAACLVMALMIVAQCALGQAGDDAEETLLLVDDAILSADGSGCVMLMAFPAALTSDELYRLTLCPEEYYELAPDAVIWVPKSCPIYETELIKLSSPNELIDYFNGFQDMMETMDWTEPPPRKGWGIGHGSYCFLYKGIIEDGKIVRLTYMELP